MSRMKRQRRFPRLLSMPCRLGSPPTGPAASSCVTREGNPNVEVFGLGTPPSFELSASTTGIGTGTVKCKFDGGPAESCSGSHPGGTEVTVETSAGPNSELTKLSGNGSASACTTSPCSFSLREETSITAEFNIEASLVAITGLTPTRSLRRRQPRSKSKARTSREPNRSNSAPTQRPPLKLKARP